MGRRKAANEKKNLVNHEEEVQIREKGSASETHELLNLQQQVGNRAIQRAIGQRPHMPRPQPPGPPLVPMPEGGEGERGRTVRCPQCGHSFTV